MVDGVRCVEVECGLQDRRLGGTRPSWSAQALTEVYEKGLSLMMGQMQFDQVLQHLIELK